MFLFGLPSFSKNILFLSPQTSFSLEDQAYSPIKITKGKIIKVKEQGSHILVLGKKKGKSELYVGKKKWTVFVLKEEDLKAFKELEGRVRLMKGLSLKVRNGSILVEGELFRPSDWVKIAEVVEKYGASILFKVKTSPFFKNFFQTYFESIASLKRLPPPRLVWTQASPYILLGSEEKKNEKIWKSWFASYGLPLVFSKNEISSQPVIGIKIHFLEINEDLSETLGLDWKIPSELNLLPLSPLSTPRLEVFFKAMKEKGGGRVLAEPYLVCENHSETHFFAGGEIPIKTYRSFKSSVSWKKYGIDIKIKASYNFEDIVKVKLSGEFSDLDMSTANYGAPGIKVKKFQSHFNMKNNSTLAIYGLHYNLSGVTRSFLPHLYKLPILGSFFQNKKTKDNSTKLVILITPRVKNNAR